MTVGDTAVNPDPTGFVWLRVIYSRTFGVCAICPQGSWVTRTLATHWVDDPDFGRWGVCDPCHEARTPERAEQ